MKNLLKKIFNKKSTKIEPDRVKNVVEFTDLNKQGIQFTIKHSNGVNLLIITADDVVNDSFCVVLDQETAVVLRAILDDFAQTGNIKHIEEILNGGK